MTSPSDSPNRWDPAALRKAAEGLSIWTDPDGHDDTNDSRMEFYRVAVRIVLGAYHAAAPEAGTTPDRARELLAELVEAYFRDVEGDSIADEERKIEDRDQDVDDLLCRARAFLASTAEPEGREAAETETVVEYRVTGDAGPDYPPYEFKWYAHEQAKADDVAKLLREASAFRRNVRDINIERRQITTTRTRWEPAEEQRDEV